MDRCAKNVCYRAENSCAWTIDGSTLFMKDITRIFMNCKWFAIYFCVRLERVRENACYERTVYNDIPWKQIHDCDF